jgi:hypothetical protein
LKKEDGKKWAGLSKSGKHVSNLAFFSVVASSPNLSTFSLCVQRYKT